MASLLCMLKRLAATDFVQRPIADLAAIFVKPCRELCNLSVIVIFFSRSKVASSVGLGLKTGLFLQKYTILCQFCLILYISKQIRKFQEEKKSIKRVTYFFFRYNLNHTYSFILSKHGQHQKVDKSTVVPTKSDSDVIFCLLLFSKTLTCKLHLSLRESRDHLCINPILRIGLIHK